MLKKETHSPERTQASIELAEYRYSLQKRTGRAVKVILGLLVGLGILGWLAIST